MNLYVYKELYSGVYEGIYTCYFPKFYIFSFTFVSENSSLYTHKLYTNLVFFQTFF